MTVTTDNYLSRVATALNLIPRAEPVVYAGGIYTQALTVEQIEQYDRDGFLVLENVFSTAEVEQYLAELHQLLNHPEFANKAEAVKELGSNTVRSLFRVHELSPLIKQIVSDSRLLNVACQLLGSDVYVHQSRANFKPGFTGQPFYWHSDFETWHVEDGMPNMRALSCSLLLTDNNEANGPLMLIPGSHRYFVPCLGQTPDEHHKKSLKKQEYGVPSQAHLTQLIDQGGLEVITAPAGSVIFFDCNTLHGSSNNMSPWPRANFFTVYNSVENTLQQPKYGLSKRPGFLAHRGEHRVLKPR